MLSWDVYTRHKAEEILDFGDVRTYTTVEEDPHFDVCAYQMILDKKAKILGPHYLQEPDSPQAYEVPRQCLSRRIPDPVLRNIRQVVFCDVKDDLSYNHWNDPESPENPWGPLGELYGPPFLTYEEDIPTLWMSGSFPALAEKPRSLLYFELCDSGTGTLVGKIETHTAGSLDVVDFPFN
ncbi:hypothetical protein PG996_010891 [Apiospora saccharicola]|uniref:Uncharacterized protein n=1 Tax=Apiospora saccharicola TaxID=335842 RepID=A0ABR1UPV7_9PEZI